MADRYIGDDLINLMTVTISAAEGTKLPEIEAVEIQIGNLHKKYTKPSNPFTVNVCRAESAKLSLKNRCYAAIWYWNYIGGNRVLLKKTCEGTMTVNLNREVVNGCQC